MAQPSAPEDLRERRVLGYEIVRPEIIKYVPRSATRTLDLGCSSGTLGAALKDRQPMSVVGVELMPEYAEDARTRLDEVHCGDVDSVLDAQGSTLGQFDCLVAADVLEHLADPWETLRKATRLLTPGATVIVSVPNVRFWLTFWNLLVRRQWPLRDVGVFDRTHLRWFTRSDAQALLASAGLEVVAVEGRHKVSYYAGKIDRVLAPIAKRTPLRDFFAAQYVVVGQVPAAGPAPQLAG
jgi:2-polyprenyl-3-methyl-5-hydroxy-6-metoxy-1,4-benzoquinol methylase